MASAGQLRKGNTLENTTTAPQAETEEVLKALDYIIVVDHSGSMSTPSTRYQGKSRLGEVQEQVENAARVSAKYDDDGLTVISFSTTAKVWDGVTPDKVASTFVEFPAKGSTNLAAALEEVGKKARASSKEVIALVYTDGEPDSYPEVENTINRLASEFGRPKIAFTFIQVGDSEDATKFLNHIDNDLKTDICVTVRASAAQDLDIEQLVWLGRHA